MRLLFYYCFYYISRYSVFFLSFFLFALYYVYDIQAKTGKKKKTNKNKKWALIRNNYYKKEYNYGCL